jgi:hypothetical protein
VNTVHLEYEKGYLEELVWSSGKSFDELQKFSTPRALHLDIWVVTLEKSMFYNHHQFNPGDLGDHWNWKLGRRLQSYAKLISGPRFRRRE